MLVGASGSGEPALMVDNPIRFFLHFKKKVANLSNAREPERRQGFCERPACWLG